MCKLLLPAALLAATAALTGRKTSVQVGLQTAPIPGTGSAFRKKNAKPLPIDERISAARLFCANSFLGMNPAIISAESLEPAMPYLTPLAWMAKDLSEEVSDGGVSVTTRIPSVPTVGDISAGITMTDMTSTAVTVTLNKQRGYGTTVNDFEIQNAARDVNWFVEQFVMPGVEYMAEDIQKQLGAVFTTAHFDSSGGVVNTLVKTAAQFGYTAINAAATQATKNKMGKLKFMLINADYLSYCREDEKFLKAINGGNQKLVEVGYLHKVLNFHLPEEGVQWIPANAINLTGLAVNPSAAALAMRTPLVPRDAVAVQAYNIVHPTGLRFQLRTWYDPNANNNTGAYKFTVSYVAGVAAGAKHQAILIKSA